MAWIESHQSLRDHPKTRKLSRVLGTSLPATIGHLQCLWWWALDYAEDGNLSRFDWDDIEMGAEWDGLPDAFVDGLIRVGFLDFTDPDGNDLTIHDWDDYAGKLIERRKANAERMRKARAERDAGTSEPRAAHVQSTTDARAERPNRTNQTKPTEPTEPPPQPPEGEGARPEPVIHEQRFESFWVAYPKKTGKEAARKWWLAQKPSATLHTKMLTAIGAQKVSLQWLREDGRFIPNPATWLNQGRWDDEEPEVPRGSLAVVYGTGGKRGRDGLTDDERGWRENPGPKGWSADELARMSMNTERSGT